MGKGTPLAESYVKINYKDLDNLDRHIDSSGRKFVNETNKMSAGLKAFGAIIATVGIVQLGKDIVSAATKWDSMEKALLYVEKTQANVNKRLAEFRIIAKDPGIGLQQLTQGYIGFTSAGIKAEPAIKLMRELANNMAAMGKGATEIERVNYQLIQMKSKGIPQLEDLRVIQEAMPNINQIIGKAFGSTNIEQLVKGGLNADKFIEGITEAMSKQERATTGARNAQDNFNDSLFQFKAALGDAVLPAVTDFLTKTTKLLDWFNALPEATQKAIGTGAIAGGGLLGVGLALNTIKTALDAIGISSGIKALASVGGGAVAGGAFKPLLNPNIVNGGVQSISTLSIVSATIGKLLLPVGAFAALWEATKWSQRGFEGNLPPGVSAGGTSTMALPRFGITSKKPSSTMSDADYAEYQRQIHEKYPSYQEYMKTKQSSASVSGGVGGTYEDFMKTYSENPFSYEYQRKYENLPGARELFGGLPLPSSDQYVRFPSAEIPVTTGFQGNIGLREGPGMAGGTVSDRSFLHQQETNWLSDTYKTKTAIYEAEKEYDKEYLARFEDNTDVMENSWDTFFEKNKMGVDELSNKWIQSINQWASLLLSSTELITKFLNNIGVETNPATVNHLTGMISGAAQGAVTGIAIGSVIPGIGNVAGGIIGGAIGAIGGYDTGGIAWRPQLAKVAESEPELIMPLSKMRSGGMGGVTIQNMTVVVPDTWDRGKIENVVVNAYNDAVSHGRIG